MIIFRQSLFSKKNKKKGNRGEFGNGFNEDDIDNASSLTSYLPTAGGALLGNGAISSAIGTFAGNKRLKKNLEKGEDYDDAKSNAILQAALVGGGVKAGTGILGLGAVNGVLNFGESCGALNELSKKDQEAYKVTRDAIRTLGPTGVALAALGAGGTAALGTYLKARSVKSEKEKRNKRK